MPHDDLTATRIRNLEANYRRWGRPDCSIPTGQPGLTVERQARDFGQAAYYGVKNGEPVAYCVGHDVHRPCGRRFVITSTFVHPEHQRQGIARAVYLAIIDSGTTLVSDWDLSPGAIALWRSLMASQPRGTVLHFKEGFVARRRLSLDAKNPTNR